MSTDRERIAAEDELQLRVNALVGVLMNLKVQNVERLDKPVGEVVNDLNWAITMAHAVHAQAQRCQHMYEEYLLQRYEDREEYSDNTPF